MRLSGFDYSRPMFYMVTLKCLPGRRALSAIVTPGRCEMNATTRAFVNCIRGFHLGCAGIEPIECFMVMPDHVHLLVKIRDQLGAKLLGETPPASGPDAAACSPKSFAPNILRLETIVSLLMQALEGRYAETTGLREQLFDARWHPTRNKEALCAEGRMLFLSLYEAQAAKPDSATLYRRCHEMGDLAVAAVRAKLVGEPPHQSPSPPTHPS